MNFPAIIASSNSEETSLCQWEEALGLLEGWYIACLSTNLKKKPKAIKLFGRNLVAFRGKNNQASVMVDQCAHRGAQLSKGKVQNDCLHCPYHGWGYDSEGKVAHIPSIDGSKPPKQGHAFRQRSFVTREVDGAIWVYLGDKDPADTPVYRMPYFDKPGFVSYYMTGLYAGGLSSIAQINMDVSHTVFVHGKLFRNSADRLVKSTIEVTDRKVEVIYEPVVEKLGAAPWLTNPKNLPINHSDRYFAPNVTQVDYHWGDSSFQFVSVVGPIDRDSSILYTCISYRLPIPKLALKAMQPLVKGYTKAVNRQDIAVMKHQLAGIRGWPTTKQNSVKADMAHVAIDKILSAQQYGIELAEQVKCKREMNFYI